MTAYFFTTNQIGSGIQAELTNNFDSAYVGSGVLVGSTGGDAIVGMGSYHVVTVRGVVGGDANGVLIGYPNVTDNSQERVTIGAGAEVYGYRQSGINIYAYESSVSNAGDIFGHFFGVRMSGASATTTSTLSNSGSIEGDFYAGVAHYGSEALSFTNSGTVTGGNYSFYDSDAAATTLINSGKLIGAVVLGGGSDVLNTTNGTVQGLISMGTGNDTVYGSAGSDSIDAGDGNDLVRGSTGNDSLDGGTGIDMLDYRDKTVAVQVGLRGDSASTVLVNAVGEDTVKNFENIYGGTANDRLFGDGLANTFYGNAGNDLLAGGAGDDVLVGGSGIDTMTGGTNADRFRFLAISESGVTPAARDVITDFHHAEHDKIDLDSIDANTTVSGLQHFVFDAHGTAATAVATGHLGWYFEDNAGTANDHTIIAINNDADTAIDMTIQLNGLVTLTSGDVLIA